MMVSSTADLFDVTVPTVNTNNDSLNWNDFTADQNTSIQNIEGDLLATKLTLEKNTE